MGAHRKKRFARVRLPAIGVAVMMTVGAGAAVAMGRDRVSTRPDAAAAAQHASFSRSEVPASAGGRARETSLTAVASPARVTLGGRVSMTVTLSSVATGRPVVGRRIEVYGQRRGGPRVLSSRLRTDGDGAVRLVRTPSAHTSYEFVFGGHGGHRAASRKLEIGVSPKLALRRNLARVPSGYVVTFLGSVSPPRRGQVVQLQVKSAKGWRTVGSRPVTGQGRYSIPLRQGRPGRYTYRAYTRGGGLDPAYTRGVSVEVAADVAGARGRGGVRRVTRAAPLRLLVTGDSLAFYVGEEMRADRRSRSRVRTALESRHSTGLARPEFFDWHRRAVAQVREAAPEAVVVWVGGNDCQPLRAPTGRWTSTGSRAWQAEYTRRTVLLMRAYATVARRVYWVGMPTARAADIDGCFRAMTAATRQAAMSVPGTTWLDTRGMFAGPDGRYADVVRGVRVRGDDGIHLNRAGSAILARRLISLLHADWRVLG